MENFLLVIVLILVLAVLFLGNKLLKVEKVDTKELNKIKELEKEKETLNNDKIRLEESEKNKIEENNKLSSKNSILEQQKSNLDIKNAELKKEIDILNQQMSEWTEKITSTVKQTSEESNKNLVNTLLETHNTQAEAGRKQTNEAFEKKEKEFFENIKGLTSTVDILKSDVEKNQELGETLKNAFSSSANIGEATETVLENTLNSFSFRKGIDFFTQFTTETLRADAIVILPDENALVIDAKASKFIYELAEAEQTEDTNTIDTAKQKLKRSMNNHLNTLSSKQYAEQVQKELNAKDHNSILRENIPTIMFLPNESAIEKVVDADPDFKRKASQKSIFICGPTSLWVAIGIAKQKVELHKKIKNYEDIEKFSASVLKNVQKVFKDTLEIKRGLGIAVKGYDGAVKTLSTNIPARVREMERLGIAEHENIKELEYIENNTEIES